MAIQRKTKTSTTILIRVRNTPEVIAYPQKHQFYRDASCFKRGKKLTQLFTLCLVIPNGVFCFSKCCIALNFLYLFAL